MSSEIPGQRELSTLWPLLIAAGDEPTRKALVSSAISAVSRMAAAVHNARRSAVCIAYPETTCKGAERESYERAGEWVIDYE